MMKHGSGDGEVSHRALFEEYMSGHVTVCPEPGPCRDEDLLSRAAQAFLLDPEPQGSATLPVLYRRVLESFVPTNLTHLSVLVRATELLETLCLNLYLQPWRREIQSVKTFTGAFVYCLLPALSSGTLQSVLATIGYLPHEAGPSPSEYRLCEEASPELALKVAFELLLTRGLCLHLLQLLKQDQPTAWEWVETLQRKVTPAALPQYRENISTRTEEEEEEKAVEEEGHQTEKMEQGPASAQVCEDPRPQAPGLTEDQSIVHLQMTYPDLVFRGRPLLQDRAPHDTSPSQHKAHQHPQRRNAQKTRALPHCNPTNKDPTVSESSSGPPGLSLHITLRPQTVKPPTCTQQLPTTDMCEENTETAGRCEAEVEPGRTQGPEPTPDNQNKQESSEEEAEQHPAEPTRAGGCERCTKDYPPSVDRDGEDSL